MEKKNLFVKAMIKNKEQQKNKHENVKRYIKITNFEEGEQENTNSFSFFFRIFLSLYDYQSKASRYRKQLTYLKNRTTTNQKHTIGSQNQKEKNTGIK